MDFNVIDPPTPPPPGWRHLLVWVLARALWEAHRPNADGFCSATGCQHYNHLHPCPSIGLALDGMRVACGRQTPTAALWRVVARRRITRQPDGPANSGWRYLRGARRDDRWG
jgi:hypothetical protein